MFFIFLVPEEYMSDFSELYEKYKQAVYYAAYDILKDVQYAEDAASETFYRAAKYYGKIRTIPKEQVGYYMVTMAKNTAFTMLEKLNKTKEIPLDGEICENVEIPFDKMIEGNALNEALDELPEKQKTILMYKYGYGFSVKEISQMLKEKENTVKVCIYRAKNKLAELLKKGSDKNE